MGYNAESLKDMYGVRFEQAVVSHFGLRLGKSRSVGNVYYCPIHGDSKTPDLHYHEDKNMFKCMACGWSRADIYQHLQEDRNMEFKEAMKWVADELNMDVDYNYKPTRSERLTTVKKKVYDKPNIKINELTKEQINYMKKRGITKETLDAWKVKSTYKFGQTMYVFQYFENNELIHVSYRGIGKDAQKGGTEKNTKAILWGFENTDKSKPLVIVEGQPDAMIVWQSGYKNVVSVPSGSNNLNWLEIHYEDLKDFKEIIVWADNDIPGLKMANEIKSRLENVSILIDEDSKDANLLHYYKGAKAVYNLIKNKINQMPDGIIDVSEHEFEYYEDRKEDGIPTGFTNLDNHTMGLQLGEVSLIVGRNGEGKTTTVSQIIGNCLENKVKTFLYSGEMGVNKTESWLYRQIIGNTPKAYFETNTRYGSIIEAKPEIIKAIKRWHRGTLYMHDLTSGNNLESILKNAEITVRKKGVKLIVIDNLMSALTETQGINHDQSNFMQTCKDFSLKHNVHIIVLVHPNKSKGEIDTGREGNITKNDISGTGNLPNKADNIIAIERNWNLDEEVDMILTLLKDRMKYNLKHRKGTRIKLLFKFSELNLRFYNSATPEEPNYSWKKHLTDDVDINTFEKIKLTGKELSDDPF